MEKNFTILTPAQKALETARWARTMTKWLITHSSKGGVKWQVVNFNGKNNQESVGIVDLIAIRKNHKKPEEGGHRGDLLEIVLLQVKGGSARFPNAKEIQRLRVVKEHHRADRIILSEWKKLKRLCLYEWLPVDSTWNDVDKIWDPPDAKWMPVEAAEIFGRLLKKASSAVQEKKGPELTVDPGKVKKAAIAEASASAELEYAALTPGRKAAFTKRKNAEAARAKSGVA